jgi:hypothetical protein
MAAWLQWMWPTPSPSENGCSDENESESEKEPSFLEVDGIILLLDKYGIASISEQVNISQLITSYSSDVVFCARSSQHNHGHSMFKMAWGFAKENTDTSVLLVTYPDEQSWDVILEEGRPDNLKIVIVVKYVQ